MPVDTRIELHDQTSSRNESGESGMRITSRRRDAMSHDNCTENFSRIIRPASGAHVLANRRWRTYPNRTMSQVC